MFSYLNLEVFGTTVRHLALFVPNTEISQKGMKTDVRKEKQKKTEEKKEKLFLPRCQICMEIHPACYH